MHIYLMARYTRYLEMQEVAHHLVALGHIKTSRWIWGAHQASDEAIGSGMLGDFERRLAEEDMADLCAAQVCVGFSEPPRAANRGGRMVELGMALAWGKRVVVVGGHEHVFHALKHVEHVLDTTALYHLFAEELSLYSTH